MTDFEVQESDRPEFRGWRIRSYIDGKDLAYYPPADAWDRFFCSHAIIGVMVIVVIGIVVRRGHRTRLFLSIDHQPCLD